MFPIWHQANVSANRATPADISALLELNGIPFIAEPSTTIPDHTCFKVGDDDKKRAITLIEQETGRFNNENQEIEVTEEERAAIDNKRAQIAAEIAEKERIYKENKEKEDEIIARIEAQLKDKRQDKKDDAEIAAIEQLTEQEEEEENVEV